MVTQDDSNKQMTARERQQIVLSERGGDASNRVSANALGVGLVLAGAVAIAIAMFLPFAQPVGGLPILGANTLFQILGWHVLWLPLLLALPVSGVSRGSRPSLWALITADLLMVVAIIVMASAKDLRTMHIIGPGGTADTSGPGMLAGLSVAIYVAAAGVAVAILGALALFQNDRNESQNDASTAQLTGGAHSRWQTTWPLAAAVVVIAVAVASYLVLGRPSTRSQDSAAWQPASSLTPAQTVLQGLLLSPEQISAAMGTTELVVNGTTGTMPDIADQVPDEACRPIVSPAESQAYRGSGWSTMLGQVLAEPGPRFRHRVEQTVVSFPSANEASAFFTASAQSWPACADRHFNVVAMGTDMAHTAGPVSNTNGTLSVTQNQDGVELVFSCQRALTVANNIVIDIAACSLKPTDGQSDVQVDSASNAAIDIAHQVAAKVPAS